MPETFDLPTDTYEAAVDAVCFRITRREGPKAACAALSAAHLCALAIAYHKELSINQVRSIFESVCSLALAANLTKQDIIDLIEAVAGPAGAKAAAPTKEGLHLAWPIAVMVANNMGVRAAMLEPNHG